MDGIAGPDALQQLRLQLRYKQSMNAKLEQLGRLGLRALRIASSTASIIELLRNDWTGGISAGLAWLVFVQVERRLPPPDGGETGSTSLG